MDGKYGKGNLRVAPQQKGHLPKVSATNTASMTFPKDPCMIYLPTFPIKINQM